MKLLLLLSLFASSLISAGNSIQLNLAYGEDNRQKLDLYLPDHQEMPYPTVVLFHGGGWQIGDKANATFLDHKREYFNSKGWAVISVNYRLSPEVVHPAHVKDAYAAIAWLQKNAGRLKLKADGMIIVGHSAGAHLAAMVGIDHLRLREAGANPEQIESVCLIDGASYHLPDAMKNAKPLLRRIYETAFTNSIENQTDASPLLNIKQDMEYPRFLILACKDRAESVGQGKALQHALQQVGAISSFTEIPNKTHRTINEDFGKKGDPTTLAMEKFLK